MRHALRLTSLSAIAAALAVAGSAAAQDETAKLEAEAAEALAQCEALAASCAAEVENAAGVLVFPDVVRVDLIVGGSGGNGVLYVDDEIAGYYDIGEASVGLQAGIDTLSMVYVFRDAATLADLHDADEWEVGAQAGLTVADADAAATAISGDPIVYVFNANGLNAGIDFGAMRIWQEDEDPTTESIREDAAR